jgi:hypothetical protein
MPNVQYGIAGLSILVIGHSFSLVIDWSLGIASLGIFTRIDQITGET